jgi:hypothetical protein
MKNRLLRYVPGLNPTLVESIIQDSYSTLSRLEWRRFNTNFTITTTGFYTTGHITISSSGIVTGHDGATFDSTFVGRYLRAYYSDSFFRIASYNVDGTLTLESWTGLTISSPIAYSIFKHRYIVPSNVGIVYGLTYNVDLVKKSIFYFDRYDPARTMSGEPVYWAYVGNDDTDSPIIEIYPIPDDAYPLRGYGKRKIVALSASDTPLLPEDLIESHALIELYRIKATLTPNQGWETRMSEQLVIYQDKLRIYEEEDYLLYAHEDKVKDRLGDRVEPVSDSFWVSHDNLID